jgi:hypothetical protein
LIQASLRPTRGGGVDEIAPAAVTGAEVPGPASRARGDKGPSTSRQQGASRGLSRHHLIAVAAESSVQSLTLNSKVSTSLPTPVLL